MHISRLYLCGSSGHRPFYWVKLADDRSLYIGSSNGKLFRYGFGGVATSAPFMHQVVPERDGRALSSQEIANKTSFHGSGVVNLSTDTDGRPDRVKVSAPRDGFEAFPLVAILPMEPARYPVSQKSIKPADLCLPECMQVGLPIGILIYVCATSATEPAPVAAARQRLSLVEELACNLEDLQLRAVIYSDPTLLPMWPTEEIQVVAHPATTGGEPNWPFFA